MWLVSACFSVGSALIVSKLLYIKLLVLCLQHVSLILAKRYDPFQIFFFLFLFSILLGFNAQFLEF